MKSAATDLVAANFFALNATLDGLRKIPGNPVNEPAWLAVGSMVELFHKTIFASMVEAAASAKALH